MIMWVDILDIATVAGMMGLLIGAIVVCVKLVKDIRNAC